MIIANPAVADVEVDETTLTLTGAALGTTTLSVTRGGKTRTWPVLVRTAVLAQRIELTMAVGEQREKSPLARGRESAHAREAQKPREQCHRAPFRATASSERP